MVVQAAAARVRPRAGRVAALLLAAWGLPGWGVGLALGVQTVRSHLPLGLTSAEVPPILFADAVVAGLGAAVAAGALFLSVGSLALRFLGRPAAPLAAWPVHLASSAAGIGAWLTLAPALQPGASATSRAVLAAVSPAVGGMLAFAVGRLAAPLSRRSGLAVAARRGAATAVVVMLGASAALGWLVLARRFERARQGSAAAAASLRPAVATGRILPPAAGAPIFPHLDPPLTRSSGGGKVIVIGVDGLGWNLLGPAIAAGEAPNLARLARSGYAAELSSMLPTKSPLIWTSVATGRAPADHGVVDFTVLQLPGLGIDRLYRGRWLPYTLPLLRHLGSARRKPVTSQERRSKAIWNLCTEAGLSVAALGWWATWPAEAVDGFMVSDHAYLDAAKEVAFAKHGELQTGGGSTYPAGAQAELARFQRPLAASGPQDLEPFVHLTAEDRERFSTYVSSEYVQPDMVTGRHPFSTMTLALLKDRFYGESALHLLDTFGPQLVLGYFSVVDWFSHAVFETTVPEAAELGHSAADIGRYRDAMRRAVAWVDAWIGKFLARADGDTTVIVLSDHGFQREILDGRVGYSHSFAPPGVLLMAGRGVPAGSRRQSARIEDVTPTLLYLLGLPLSDELAGELLAPALDPRLLAAFPPRSVPTYEAGPPLLTAATETAAAEDQMMENLRALGYID